MKLLEKLRPAPDWESPDPSTRAAAVRDLDDDDGTQQLFLELARDDADPGVRREAVSRVGDLAALVEICGADDDPGVRSQAQAVVRELLIDATDTDGASGGLQALTDERDLMAVAREARLESVSEAAVALLTSQRALGAVARLAPHAAAVQAAFARLDDPDELQSVAVKAADRAMACVAFDRLAAASPTRAVLEQLEKRAVHKAVRRRARAALETLDAREQPAPPTAREGVLEGVAALEVETDFERGRDAFDRLLARWADLDGAPSPEEARRFAAAREAAEARLAALEPIAPPPRREVAPEPVESPPPSARASAEAQPGFDLIALEAVVSELEALVAPDVESVPQAQWSRLCARWKALLPPDVAIEGPAGALDQRRVAAEVRRAEILAEAADRKVQAEQDGLRRIRQRCRTLEGLVTAEQLRLVEGERQLRAARRVLDDPGPLPRKERDAALRSLRQAHAKLLARVHELRELVEWQQWANLGVQETLCAELEALDGRPADEPIVEAFQAILARWRQVADVPKQQGAALWQRFKRAHDAVFPRYQRELDAQTVERQGNVARLTALAEEAERLADSSAWQETVRRINQLQAEWKATGPVPHAEQRRLWTRFRAACNTFFKRRKADLAACKQQWDQNQTRKEALCEEIEAASRADDLAAAMAVAERVQAEWKTIGPVRRSKSEALWQRFRTACDAVAARSGEQIRASAAEGVAALEALCVEMEGLQSVSPESGQALGEAVSALQGRWREAPEVPPPLRRPLAARFGQALARVTAAHPDRFRGTDLDPERILKRLETLCQRVEALRLPADPARTGATPAEILASRWREALASNLMGQRVDEASERQAALDTVKRARQEFRRLGPVSGEEGQRLVKRFRAACDRAEAWAGPKAPGRRPRARGSGPQPVAARAES